MFEFKSENYYSSSMYIKDLHTSINFESKKYSSAEAVKILRSYKVIDSKGKITPKYSSILVKNK